MDNDPDIANDVPATSPKPKRTHNPRWVGLIMVLFIPGSAHFLSGQRRLGVLLYATFVSLLFLLTFLASVPHVGFFYVAVCCFVVWILLYLAVLLSSWRPTRRIGCFGWLLFIAIIVLQPYGVEQLALLFKAHAVELFKMSGTSMSPTIIAPSPFAPDTQRADRIVANKWLYRFGNPQRGDIVTFRAWHDPTIIYIKRIVGLPGETVDIESPYILINGERLTYPPIFSRISSGQDGFSGYYTAEEIDGVGVPLPITLGVDEYFVMGDNSPNSWDSRFNGPILRESITGKAIRIFYPFNRIREIE